jgi:hypothetical protein
LQLTKGAQPIVDQPADPLRREQRKDMALGVVRAPVRPSTTFEHRSELSGSVIDVGLGPVRLRRIVLATATDSRQLVANEV